MKIINLYGPPSAGKSVTAATVFSFLKRHSIDAELVGEVTKELIYRGNDVQLINQVYIMGCQYRKLVDLNRNGINIAISDSPLLLQLVYAQFTCPQYYEELRALVLKLNSEFENINVYVKRTNPYQKQGRVHTEEQSLKLDEIIWEEIKDQLHFTINSDAEGLEIICGEALKLADKELIEKF